MHESKKKDALRPSTSGSEHQHASDSAGKAALNQDLTGLVDDLEEQVVEERQQEGLPGNRADREDATPIDTGDRAPD
ncbi:hypothetical protein [Rhodococcus qingshengii]